MAVDIIITLTAVGTDTSATYNLFSNVDGFASPYETAVPVASLQSGYTTSAPDGTNTVRVCNTGVKCLNCIDITPLYTTTTTTSSTTTEAPTTTTTTTSASWAGLIEVDDCLDNDGQGYLITSTNGNLGNIILNDVGSPFDGKGNFYRLTFPGTDGFVSDLSGLIISDYIIQIDGTGTIIIVTDC